MPRRAFVIAALLLGAAGCEISGLARVAQAEDDKVVPVPLRVRPAAEHREALKYRLLPDALDRKPGNAAVLYNKIALQLAQRHDDKSLDKMADWLDLPLAKFPRDEVRAALRGYQGILDDLALAARRQTCDWQLPFTEHDPISLLLPEVQYMRNFGRMVALKARLEIADGNLDEALRTLQTGYSLTRDVAQGQTLINGLVGLATAGVMDARLEELIQQPGAPNLYWALTSRPRPLIDMRPGMDMEMNMVYLGFPELRDVEGGSRSAESWRAQLDQIGRRLSEWTGNGSGDKQPPMSLIITGLALKGYPQARQDLIARGRSPEEVDAMPVAQVVAIYTVHTYNEFRDQIFKWLYVPYWEGRTGLEKAEVTLRREVKSREIVPLASLLLPAIHSVNLAAARGERRTAALRTIEALRMYAASHEGKLPEKLADVVQVPVPNDPITGQPFVYRLQGDEAVLEGFPPPGAPAKANGFRYEIKLIK